MGRICGHRINDFGVCIPNRSARNLSKVATYLIKLLPLPFSRGVELARISRCNVCYTNERGREACHPHKARSSLK